MLIPALLQRLRYCTLLAALGLLALIAPRAIADDAAATADIIQFGFEPTTLQVAPGTTVTWTNHDAIIHSVTSGEQNVTRRRLRLGVLGIQTGTFSFTFIDTGDYTYFLYAPYLHARNDLGHSDSGSIARNST